MAAILVHLLTLPGPHRPHRPHRPRRPRLSRASTGIINPSICDPFLVALYPILDDRYPQPPGLADPAGR